MKNVLADTQRGVVATPTDHICTPRPAGMGKGGGRRVRQGSTSPAPSPFTQLLQNLAQSLHLKYTCSKRAVSNLSSLYTLFFSVIYNSVITV